jgi:hypothetical protein
MKTVPVLWWNSKSHTAVFNLKSFKLNNSQASELWILDLKNPRANEYE